MKRILLFPRLEWPYSRSRPLADAQLAKALNRFALAEILELEHLSDLDLAIPIEGLGKPLRPLHGFLARFRLDDAVAGTTFLGFGKWTVNDASLAARIADAPACRGGPQAVRIEENARLGKLLVIVGHLCKN